MALTFTHQDQPFSIGDTIRVYQKISEKVGKEEKTRTQAFEGMVIGARGQGQSKSFIVRRIAVGRIGVERIFPLFSPLIDRVEVVSRGAVRRAKLYFLRDKATRETAEITKRFTRRESAKTASAKKTVKIKDKAKVATAAGKRAKKVKATPRKTTKSRAKKA